MTRVFTDDGAHVPVTVIEAAPNRVTRLATPEKDGYRAVQVAWGSRRRSLINKPDAGQLAKAEVDTAEGLIEFRLGAEEGKDLAPGAQIKVDQFQPGQIVDVSGTTMGKGFAGVIKRHHFGGGNETHGASLAHRVPGSTGQRQSPGKVFKGKRMPGHLGHDRRTTQNLQVVRVDADRNLLLVKGAVPGPRGGRVIVWPAVKNRKKKG
jgi:large subunit ribosomal protein L3